MKIKIVTHMIAESDKGEILTHAVEETGVEYEDVWSVRNSISVHCETLRRVWEEMKKII